MSKTIIIVSGGVIQTVITNDPNAKFIEVDWDDIKSGEARQDIQPYVVSEKIFDWHLKQIDFETNKAHELKEKELHQKEGTRPL